ncbi:hypothetical protein GJ496_006127 [Pomphorhynchus laevis]|nr:hypothetical protein GJ496_006775 [Pomphorhynchus laevis]KAI0985532.1 hypothetical protein GJ496_006127 [Pomphorhynchus laevis]
MIISVYCDEAQYRLKISKKTRICKILRGLRKDPRRYQILEMSVGVGRILENHRIFLLQTTPGPQFTYIVQRRNMQVAWNEANMRRPRNIQVAFAWNEANIRTIRALYREYYWRSFMHDVMLNYDSGYDSN